MTIYVNGKKEEMPKDTTMEQCIEKLGYEKKKIAVELNEEILPKSQYESRILSEYDTLEIVTFVGGG
ncbi:MAG: sulfur carrier protein ThiS [Hespellia sp.]|nr:sulfur carrier protein ThiS [Hespellia sp.]